MKSKVMQKMKQDLKDLVVKIRAGKAEHHQHMRESYEFRHLHIVRCLLRGRKIEEIENKNREDNKRDDKRVERLLEEYTKLLESEKASISELAEATA